jgi:coenzyme F420-0:L-glutamate ligase/coenzyme F420-1:gamma-L-glutamate ligase
VNAPEVLADVIQRRRSIRRFRDEAVPETLIEQIVALAAGAPSASNRQDWTFTAVTSAVHKQTLAQAVRGRWTEILDRNRGSGTFAEVGQYAGSFSDFADAPVVIVISARAPSALHRQIAGEAARAVEGSFASAAMAAQNLMLAAHAFGLGSCCMTGPLVAEDALRNILGLSAREEIVCLVKLGWPAEAPPVPARKPLATILRWLR